MPSPTHQPFSHKRLVSRYLLLYCLFGLIVGVHLGANAWVLRVLSPEWDKGPHLLMALMMAGMLSGEHMGGWISDRYSGVTAVILAAVLFTVAGGAVSIAILTKVPSLVGVGGLAFGLGLGIQHSSLDTWFTVSTRFNSGRKPTDAELQRGFTTYTLGVFFGSVLALPLMYGWAWNLQIAESDGMKPLVLALSPSPYVLALAAGLLVFLFRPYSLDKALTDSASEPVASDAASKHSSILGRISTAVFTIPRAYANVFRNGGITLITMLIVGSAVSFLIFHIDAFAPTDFLSGNTVWQKTVGLAILCFFTFVIVGIFSSGLESNKALHTLSPMRRSAVIGVNLLVSAALLCLIPAFRDHGNQLIITALLLAISSGLINTLPQLVKWAVLDCAEIADKGKAAATLGIAKRIPNLVVSLAIAGFQAPLEKNKGFAYGLLIAANLVALGALAVYIAKIRRFRVTLDYPTTQDVAISEMVTTRLRETPGSTVEDIIHQRTNGRTRLTVSLSSTSKEYLTLLVSTLRKEQGVGRAILRRVARR